MIEWGDRSRPVARWLPAALVRPFDRVADWLDVEVTVIRSHSLRNHPAYPAPVIWRIARWDVAHLVLMLVSSAGYSLYLGSWLKGMTLGPLIYALAWMAVTWML